MFIYNVVFVSLAPWGGSSNIPQCSTECSIAASKLSYLPGKTYTYDYTGKANVELKDVEGGTVDTKWSAKVQLTWISPCDMAITVKIINELGEYNFSYSSYTMLLSCIMKCRSIIILHFIHRSSL